MHSVFYMFDVYEHFFLIRPQHCLLSHSPDQNSYFQHAGIHSQIFYFVLHGNYRYGGGYTPVEGCDPGVRVFLYSPTAATMAPPVIADCLIAVDLKQIKTPGTWNYFMPSVPSCQPNYSWVVDNGWLAGPCWYIGECVCVCVWG